MIYELVVKKHSEESERAERMLRECLAEGLLGEDGVLKVVMVNDGEELKTSFGMEMKEEILPALCVKARYLDEGKWYRSLDEIQAFVHKVRAERKV